MAFAIIAVAVLATWFVSFGSIRSQTKIIDAAYERVERKEELNTEESIIVLVRGAGILITRFILIPGLCIYAGFLVGRL